MFILIQHLDSSKSLLREWHILPTESLASWSFRSFPRGFLYIQEDLAIPDSWKEILTVYPTEVPNERLSDLI